MVSLSLASSKFRIKLLPISKDFVGCVLTLPCISFDFKAAISFSNAEFWSVSVLLWFLISRSSDRKESYCVWEAWKDSERPDTTAVSSAICWLILLTFWSTFLISLAMWRQLGHGQTPDASCSVSETHLTWNHWQHRQHLIELLPFLLLGLILQPWMQVTSRDWAKPTARPGEEQVLGFGAADTRGLTVVWLG